MEANFNKAREAFPQLYLLNNDELKVAMTAPAKEAIQATAPKVFEAAHVMDFNESGDVVGFFGQGADPSDQVIKFLEPVKCGDDRAATFVQIEAAMRARVKHDMHAQVALNEWSVETKPVGIAEALIIADEVFFCKMATEAITTGGLYVALDKVTEMVGQLIDHCHVQKTKNLMQLHNARIIVATTWKRRIAQLRRNSCRNVNEMQWKAFSRFYFDAEEKCIKVKTGEAYYAKVGEHSLDHNYEYQGMCSLLVVTELTEKLNFNYAEAIGTGKGHAALGPAGTGKTESAKDFAKKLGKKMVTINCSD